MPKLKVGNSFKNSVYNVFVLIFLSFITPLCAQETHSDKLNDANREIYEFPDKAILVGLEIYNAVDSTVEEKVDALMLISTAYSSKRNYVMSLEYANKALSLLDEIKNIAFKIKVLNKVGAQYQQLKIYDKAISYLDEALFISNTLNNKDSIANLLGYNYGARGFIYREQMSCEIALNYFNKALYYFQLGLKTDRIMNANISIINYNKGNCFNSINKIDSAKFSFNQAIVFSKVIDAKSLEGFAKKGMAEVLTAEGNYTQSIEILNNALSLSSEVGDLILNQGIYKGLTDNYLAINDKKNYEVFKKHFETVQSTIKNNEKNTINNSLSNIFKDNQTEISALKLKLNFYYFGIIFIAFSFLILLYIEIKRYRSKSKKLKITQQNLLKTHRKD